MPTAKFSAYYQCIEYTGANSAEILAAIPSNEDSGQTVTPYIVSEGGGTLVLETSGILGGVITLTIQTGYWLVISPPNTNSGLQGVTMYANESDFRQLYGEVLDTEGIAGELVADENFINAILAEVPDPALPVLRYQVARVALPSLLLNGTTSAVAVFDAAMPNTNYQVRWRAVAGAAVLSMIVANGAVTKSTSQVTIPLRANGLASVAGVLLVEVFELAAS